MKNDNIIECLWKICGFSLLLLCFDFSDFPKCCLLHIIIIIYGIYNEKNEYKKQFKHFYCFKEFSNVKWNKIKYQQADNAN